MNRLKTMTAGFMAAWGMLVDHHFPESWISPFRMNVPSRYVLAAFPVVGVVLGMIPVIMGKIGTLFFGTFFGAALFTLSAAVIMLGKDRGRGIALLISYITARAKGSSSAESLEIMSAEPALALSSQLVTLLTAVASVAVLGLLFRLGITGNYSWFAAVCAADCLIQGRLCLTINRNSGASFIPDNGSGIRLLAGIGIIIALILLALLHHLAVLIAIVAVWIWFWRDLPNSAAFRAGISADAVTLSGLWCAIIVLLCGTCL